MLLSAVHHLRDIRLWPLLGWAIVLFICPVGPVAAQTDSPNDVGSFIADVPLMPATSLDTMRSVSFDTATGRVLVLFIKMPAQDNDVQSFYNETLQALGWERDGVHFIKGAEMLKLKAAPQAGPNVWKLTLSPRPVS